MDTKIIFLDIDGTILSHSTGKIPESTIDAIHQARAKGHLIFINTGRTLAEIDPHIREIGFDGYVCGCGTYISYKDKLLMHEPIPTGLCQSIVEDLKSYHIDAILEGTYAIYYDFNSSHPIISRQRDIQKNQSNFNVLDWSSPDISFDKFCFWNEAYEHSQDFLLKYKERFDIIMHPGYFHEMIPAGHSKATGIQYLLNHLDIPFENTFAVGDSSNDMPMLTYVKNSIAMGNAEDCVKDIAAYVTEAVDEDGISHAFQHFGII